MFDVPPIIKAAKFRGSSLRDLRTFPDKARREAGQQIDQVQRGLEPDDWKPMPTVGQQTSKTDLDLAEKRYRELIKEIKESA
ncbi:MAG: hypothetical protein LBF16_08235 [Pseudomonadales bacterium]|nr:hypothetical protein [Pseudomonadales bacterium]